MCKAEPASPRAREPADTRCTLDTLVPLDVTACIQYPLWGKPPNFLPFIQ